MSLSESDVCPEFRLEGGNEGGRQTLALLNVINAFSWDGLRKKNRFQT